MILEKSFDNGFELVVAPTQSPVAALQVWVDAGSIDERPDEAGFCHFLEHMLFKGTPGRTTQEIAESIEGGGGEMNAFTSFEHTVYHITLANDRWRLANEILHDMVLHSTFLPKEFSPEKEVILEEIKRSQDSPDRQLYQGMYEMLYGKAGYGRPVIGSPKTVSACTAARLKSFWRKWYAPGLMTLVVCGDVDAKEVEKEVGRTWGKGGRRASQAMRPRRREHGFPSGRHAKPAQCLRMQNYDVSSVKWLAGLPACSMWHDDLPALDLATMILGQGDSSRLYNALYRDKGLVTSVGTSLWAQTAPGMLIVDADVAPENAKGFQEEIWKEVEKFCEAGPTSDEFERARVAIETDRIYAVQSMEGFAGRLGFLKTCVGNVRFDLEYMAMVRELTLEDIRDVARKYFIEGRAEGGLRECALVPKDMETSVLTAGSLIREGAPKKSAARSKSAGSSIQKLTLKEGIELVLIPRQDLPIVSVQACALGGMKAESGSNAGIGNILAEAWEQGPKGWSPLKFSHFLEKRGARVDSFSGRNSLGSAATMLTHQVDEVLPVFCEMLMEPEFSSQEIERSKSVAIEDIRAIADDGARLCGRNFNEELFGEHPYSLPLVGRLESVPKLDREAVQRHFEETFLSGRKSIAVCGKFNASHVIAILEKGLKAAAQKNAPGTVAPVMRAPLAPRLIEIKKKREQSHVIVGFLGSTIQTEARYELRVLQTVLGGQSGRLFREIRDKRGLCYTVSPISFEGVDPGYFGVYIGCDPEKRHQAIDAIHEELRKVSERKITAGELRRSKEYLYGRNHMEMQIAGSAASAAAFNVLYGLGFDEHEKLGENLRQVSIQSVQGLAKRILGQPSVTSIVV